MNTLPRYPVKQKADSDAELARRQLLRAAVSGLKNIKDEAPNLKRQVEQAANVPALRAAVASLNERLGELARVVEMLAEETGGPAR